MQREQLKIGGRYNWCNQAERLVYLGRPISGGSRGWHQFALTEKPDVVWCEVTDEDLASIEETVPDLTLDFSGLEALIAGITDVRIKRPGLLTMSARQWRKQSKAARRAAKQGAPDA